MARGGRHPDKDIRKAVKQAQDAGWTIKNGKGHRWGTLACGHGCELAVWSTPRRPGAIAKRIRENVQKCPHDLTGNVDESNDQGD